MSAILMPERTRLTAVKTQIAPVVRGAFHAAEGFNSAYVLTKEGTRVSRTRILATVMNIFVSDDGQYGFLVLDDETETIRVKFFKDTKPLESIAIGDIVDVIGKVRVYEGETYVQPEIVRKIEDPNFLVLRMAELLLQRHVLEKTRARLHEIMKQTSDIEEVKKLAAAAGIDPDTVETLVQAYEEQEAPEERRVAKERVLAAIAKLDDGSGAEYGAVIKETALNERAVEAVINDLLEDGTCYEPRPGRVKKL